MSTINYAVEIKCDTVNNVVSGDFGLESDKYFRWITGRPSYNGEPGMPYPKWEDDTDNTETWYEGIILEDGLSNPSRRIDISVSGQYGTLSGMNISIANYNKFFNFLQTNDIYTLGRNVRVFAVIDDKFYQIWNGVIQDIQYDEKSFKYVLKDNYKQIHKVIPPNEIPTLDSSGTTNSNENQIVPVTIGRVATANIYKYNVDNDYIPLVITGNKSYNMAALVSINYSDAYKATIVGLSTPGVQYIEDELVGYYLIGIKGNLLDTVVRKITHNLTTLSNRTYVYVKESFGISQDDASAHYYDYNLNDKDDVWWFGILPLDNIYIYSNYDINYPWILYKNGKESIFSYDTDANTIAVIDNNGFDTTTDNAYGYPYVSIQTGNEGQGIIYNYYYRMSIPYRKITSAKNFNYQDFVFYVVKTWGGYAQTGPFTEVTQAELTNWMFVVNWYLPGNMLRAVSLGSQAKGVYFNHREFYIDVLFSEPELQGDEWKDAEDFYLCVNFKVILPGVPFNVNLSISSVDVYDNITSTFDSFVYPPDGSSEAHSGTFACNNIPYDFFNKAYITGSYYDDYFWGKSEVIGTELYDYKEMMKIDSSVKDDIIAGKIPPKFRITFAVDIDSTFKRDVEVDIEQVVLVYSKKIDLNAGNIYASLIGEGTSGATGSVASVYSTFKTILEDYDSAGYTGRFGDTGGLTGVNYIDYGNLPVVRSDWEVGIQIEEKKSSYEYLNSLCKQSFCGMFPARNGNRKIVAWRDLEDYTAEIGETGIIRDSISKFEKSDPSEVFNDIILNYNYNYARKEFDRKIVITNTDKESFPDSSNPSEWTKYVSGVNDNTYADAKILWDILNHSRQITNNRISNPKDTQDLKWFTSSAVFSNAFNFFDSIRGLVKFGASVDDSAFKFLKNLVEWSGLLKDECSFSIPLTAENIQLELLDMILFSDGFFTDGVQRKGWITKIEIDVKKNQIKLTVTLEPLEIMEDDVIIERGIPLNVDIIEESGSQPDIIIES